MIHPHIREHLFYYGSMTLLQVLGFVLILSVSPQVQLQMLLVILTSVLYFLWAMLHQYLHHDVHPKIVLEYLLVGFLGVSISFFIFRMQM